MKKILMYIRHTAKEWSSNNPLLLGAAISFYVILSTGPILTVMIFAAGLVMGKHPAEGKFLSEINSLAGSKAAGMIGSIIQKAANSDTTTGTILTSIPLLLFGSTMVFFQLKNALDSLWEGQLKTNTKMKTKLREYLLSIVMLFITGLFFFLLMSRTVIVNSTDDILSRVFMSRPLLSGIFNVVFTFILVTLFFALVYKILIRFKIRWRDVITGALVTAVLFTIVQIIIGINFSASNIESAYGAIGTLTIWFLWIFYSSLAFLFGAAFLKIYCRDKGYKHF